MDQNKIVLYHRVMHRENFEKAATDIFNLLKSAQTKSPNVARILYVDIDGHKNDQSGYDNDMFELQKDFGLGFLAKYFTEVHFPLGDFINSKPQCNDIPDKLEIFSANNEKDTSLNDLYIENHSTKTITELPTRHFNFPLSSRIGRSEDRAKAHDILSIFSIDKIYCATEYIIVSNKRGCDIM